MKETMSKTVELDIRGQICPSSLLSTLRELNTRSTRIKEGGEDIVVVTDNRDCLTTIPQTAMNMGFFVKVEKVESHYVIRISSREL
jgi:TusA-related sulfurtransferase